MKLIELVGKNGSIVGNYAMVDDADYEWLNQWKWHCGGNGTGYAVRSFPIPKTEGIQKFKQVPMHRLIMQVSDPKIHVDHEDHNGFNNQRNNLRIATSSQNGANRKVKINSKSKYLGLCTQKVINKYGTEYIYWKATCIKDGKDYNKYCKTEIEAALEYNKMAIKYHGEFANLNIIE